MARAFAPPAPARTAWGGAADPAQTPTAGAAGDAGTTPLVRDHPDTTTTTLRARAHSHTERERQFVQGPVAPFSLQRSSLATCPATRGVDHRQQELGGPVYTGESTGPDISGPVRISLCLPSLGSIACDRSWEKRAIIVKSAARGPEQEEKGMDENQSKCLTLRKKFLRRVP